MPNTPGQIGAGITAYAAISPLEPADAQLAKRVFTALGEALEVPEADLDAVTAISGSGPAYLFEFTAALEAAGKQLGLPADVSRKLARQTIIGSAELMKTSGEDAVVLRQHVTSPGGTTQAALQSFERDQLRDVIQRATQAAHARSIELAASAAR